LEYLLLGQYRLLIVVSLPAILLDQVSKLIASAILSEGRIYSLISSFIELRFRENPGMGWGLAAGLSSVTQRLLIPVLVAIVGVGLILFYNALATTDSLRRSAVALILGGGLGNLVDHLRLGAVVDFIGVQLNRADWTMNGTFNLADLWIVLGLVLLTVGTVRKGRPEGGIVDQGGGT